MLESPINLNVELSRCTAIMNILRTPSGLTNGIIPSRINTKAMAVNRSVHTRQATSPHVARVCEMAALDSSTLSPESFCLENVFQTFSTSSIPGVVMRFERAHDRHKFARSEFEQQSEAMLTLKGGRAGARNSHSHSSALASCVALPAPSMEPSAGGNMCTQNASEQVRARQLVQHTG